MEKAAAEGSVAVVRGTFDWSDIGSWQAMAELSAPVAGQYPVQFVSFADVQKDPGLHFEAGGPSAERTLNVLFGKNVQAGRRYLVTKTT